MTSGLNDREAQIALSHADRTVGSGATVSHGAQLGESGRGLDTTTITWLHLSDLHHRRPSSRQNRIHLRNSKVVLEKLLEDIQRLIRDDGLQPDFIVFTGDIAYSGHPDEYRQVNASDDFDRAADFFDRLLQTTNLSRQRLFVVPGNHDVNWKAIEDAPVIADGCVTRLRNRDAVTDFLAPENESDRSAAFRKFRHYAEFIRRYFEGALSFDKEEYFYVKHLSLYRRVAILGLNSAWMSGFAIKDGEAQDRHNLLVGELQVRDALEQAEDAEIRIALLHHPFDWLQDFDRQAVKPLLLNGCDFILRGHQHQSGIVQLKSPDGTTLVIPAGACYNRREYRKGDDGYNGYNFVHLDFSADKGTIFWRRYDDRRGGRWAADTGLFDKARLGKYEFDLSKALLFKPVTKSPFETKPQVDLESRRAEKPLPAPSPCPTPRPGKGEQLPLVEIVTSSGQRVRGWLINVLRDPLWQGIGAIVAIIALLLTVGPIVYRQVIVPETPTRVATVTPMPSEEVVIEIDGVVIDVGGDRCQEIVCNSSPIIQVTVLDFEGVPLRPDIFSYNWRFNPPDSHNLDKLDSKNYAVIYSVPCEHENQAVTIEVLRDGETLCVRRICFTIK